MSKKILIIEDDTFLQGLAANKLGDAGFDVTTASDGDEAMTELAKGKFNCILLDLMLPDISGFDFSPMVIMILLKIITLFINANLPLNLL